MGRTLSGDSANVIALPASPTGFTAGDYVYQTTAGYGAVPAGALATGNFDLGAVASTVYASTATTSNELTYVEQRGGSQGSQVAAQLVDTNIVYAYATGSPSAYSAASTVNFRIETTTGTVVVAETSTTMTVLGPFGVSVIALPAGGFAIVCTTNSSTNYTLSARFYNADGTAATAVLGPTVTLSGNAPTYSRLKLQPLTDGSVIIGSINNTNFQLRKVTVAGFDATFGTSGITTVATRTSATQYWDFITDSSNNIQTIVSADASNTQVTMRRYNSGGVQQTTSTVSTLVGVAAVAIVLSSDGTIRGIVQDSTGVTTLTWNGTTAALGTRIITSTTPPGGGALGAFAQGASGGYVVFYNAFIGGTNAIGLFFQAFDSSNVALASATRVNSAIAVNYRNQLTPIVISGNTRVYFGVFQAQAETITLNNVGVPIGIAYFAYSNTTYALVGVSTVGFNYGSQGPFALGAYMRGVSTAGIARFTIATTGTYPVTTNTLGATLIPKTLVDSETVLRLSLAPLPNGEFVAVWARNTGGATFISKYSATGVLQAGPVTVSAAGVSVDSRQAASVATFADGNILVTYADATATTLRFRIYTPSLTVVTSGNIDTAALLSRAAIPVSCASFGDGDHIAVLFLDSADNIQVRCVQSTGTVTARLGTGLTSGTSWFQPQVIGFKSNAFVIAALDASTTSVAAQAVRKSGPTSFVAGTPTIIAGSFASIGSAVCLGSPIATPGTSAFYIGGNTGGTSYRIISINPLFNATNQLSVSNTSGSFSGYSVGSSEAATIGYTATGLPVIVANRGSTSFITLSAFTNPMDGTSASTAAVVTALATATSVSVSAIPHIGDAILIGFIDNSNKAAFTSIVASPFTPSGTLTAGTDISTSTLNLTPATGFALQGISITAAASGNSGLVQTSGIATLNSNYSASTPATFFDSRNPITAGTSGTIIGRTVIMGN